MLTPSDIGVDRTVYRPSSHPTSDGAGHREPGAGEPGGPVVRFDDVVSMLCWMADRWLAVGAGGVLRPGLTGAGGSRMMILLGVLNSGK